MDHTTCNSETGPSTAVHADHTSLIATLELRLKHGHNEKNTLSYLSGSADATGIQRAPGRTYCGVTENTRTN